MQAVITCSFNNTLQHAVRRKEHFMQLASVQSVYSILSKKIRIQWHSDTVWILFSLNLRQIVWLYFFHMVPELDEEAFRNRKEDLDQDSL